MILLDGFSRPSLATQTRLPLLSACTSHSEPTLLLPLDPINSGCALVLFLKPYLLDFNSYTSTYLDMSSLSVAAPLRAALLQKSALHLPVRGAIAMYGLRIPVLACTHPPLPGKRAISSTRQKQIKEYFPPPPQPNVQQVETAWVHPV